jgi:hypothetical protein
MKSLAEDPLYQMVNLASNNIYIRPIYEKFLEDITGLVNHVPKDCDSLDLSLDQLRQDAALHSLEMGALESDLVRYFQAVFPNP